MRRLPTILLVLCLVLAVGAVSSGAATQLTFATGGTAGTYYPLGGAMAQVWNKNVPGINVSVQATGASVENVRLINKDQVDLAFIQNDIADYAYKGTETFSKEKLPEFSVIGALYPETVQIVVRAESSLRTVSDLKGKRVSVGAPGSGVEANARQILSAFGLSYRDLNPYFLSFAESADQFKNGQIDALFVVAGHPTAAVQDIAAQHKIRILEFSDAMVAKLATKYRFFSKVTLAAGTYGMTAAVDTVAVKAILICRNELDENLVYNLTKTLYENLGQLGHAKASEIKLAEAKIGLSTPIHPGALKYYKEKGLK